MRTPISSFNVNSKDFCLQVLKARPLLLYGILVDSVLCGLIFKDELVLLCFLWLSVRWSVRAPTVGTVGTVGGRVSERASVKTPCS